MRILFQGDSITDASRSRETDANPGLGYPNLIKSQFMYEYPGEYEFFNRGISGNRVLDLLARMKVDMINLKPDVMSILIGVNDVWHEVCREPERKNGVRADLYETIYNLLITELKGALPSLRIMIMEPFVLEASATTDHWEEFKQEVTLRAEAAKRVAEKNGLEFIALQDKLDEACKKQPAEYWLVDGVHPTAAGHELIAREWVKVFLQQKV